MRVKKISPSILSADFMKLGEEVRAVESCGADILHVDVMDGRFVPGITIGSVVVEQLGRFSHIPLDVHLMVEEPARIVDQYLVDRVQTLVVHLEAAGHLHRLIQFIKDKGVRAGASLNPATPLSMLEEILPDLDQVLIMTVNPGFGGQSLISSVIPKIARLRRWIDEKGYNTELAVDGGISLENVSEVSRAGADVLVAGSAIFHSKDYGVTIRTLRERAEDVAS
ncbi:MAG: ribulose-phosphate 3-epimerase [Deltaproteobacteria bacterium]|nr:ribulose-phosphate 3-epimerase [Deltaproteobacteria bacterium]